MHRERIKFIIRIIREIGFSHIALERNKCSGITEARRRGRGQRDTGREKERERETREREERETWDACVQHRKETHIATTRPASSSSFLIVFDDSPPLDGPTWPLIRPAGDLPSAALGNCNSGLRIQGGVISLPCEYGLEEARAG